MSKLLSAVAWLSLSLAACGGEQERFGPDDDETPGQTPWNHDENVACTSNADCAQGESCDEGVCQMARCLDSYESLAPMGLNHYFGTDGEIAVISDDTFIDAFEPAEQSYISSWDLQGMGGKVLDVAGGNLTGSRPQNVAVILENSETIYVSTPEGVQTADIGMWPKVIAAGDVDADGHDELVAFAEDGTIAVCDFVEGVCQGAAIDGANGKDVAVADVDGDGYDEVVLLLDYEGESEIIIWNLDAETTQQEESYGWQLNFPIVAMGAGHISGAKTAEIVVLEDGGWWGWADDKIYVFSPAQEAFVAQSGINGHTLDVAVGDRNSDDIDEIAILTDSKKIELRYMTPQAELWTIGTTQVSVAQAVHRLSMLDWDGDSASGRLVAGPELVAGKAVPVAALMFPPYPAGVTGNDAGSDITIGDTESTDETLSDTVSLSVGMGLSFGAEAFGFKAKVGGFINTEYSVTHSETKSMSIGARYTVSAEPELHGTGYAPVITSCGCYHRYQYQLDDPASIVGTTGETVDIFVPVGGQSQLWSSKRYNAMAKASGQLPEILVPLRVGDPASYPTEPQTLDGQAIAVEDMLFPEVPSYQSSDVGYVSFWLQAGETASNSVAETTELGVNASFGAGIVEVEAEIGIGVTQGYTLTVGRSSLWSGSVPPVPDDTNTPEDEYEVHRFSFQPFVFRQRYVDVYGEESAFMVMHYTVDK